MEQRGRTLLIFLAFSIVNSSQGQKDICIPLNKCPSLLLLLKNRDDLPNMTRVDVYRYFHSIGCGFSGHDPLIYCPDIEEDQNELEDEGDISSRFGGGLADFVSSELYCDGSLTLIHTVTESQDATQELRSMKTIRLTGQKYPDLGRRILTDDRKLLHIESNGNCCWQFSSSQNFRGATEFASIGFKGLPVRQVRSIKQISCDLVKE